MTFEGSEMSFWLMEQNIAPRKYPSSETAHRVAGEGLLCAEATLSFSRARHSGYIYHHAVSQLLLDPRYLALLLS
jgi:hypothetical protein